MSQLVLEMKNGHNGQVNLAQGPAMTARFRERMTFPAHQSRAKKRFENQFCIRQPQVTTHYPSLGQFPWITLISDHIPQKTMNASSIRNSHCPIFWHNAGCLDTYVTNKNSYCEVHVDCYKISGKKQTHN